MKIAVITCITGGKDTLLEDQQNAKMADFIAFTDTDQKSDTWTIKKAPDVFKDPRRNSRLPKILPHLYVDAEYSIYIDGNIRLLKTPQELIETYLKDYDLAIFKHPIRDCIYDEAIKCAQLRLDDPEVIIEQAKAYEDNGYGKHKGLCECGIILRRHTPKVKELNECWMSHYARYSRRDQISFMKAVDEVGIPIKVIDLPFILREDGTAERRGGLAEVTFHNHYV
jgi:hypothetical protein